jgi:hypothetical protein
MTIQTYLFEAKSIQSYILATNRLKEMVGASELVESLCSRLLDDTLASLGGTGRVEFSRRGGGAFFAFSPDSEAIDGLTTLWPLLVRQYAPDLYFVHARAAGIDPRNAYDAAHQQLLADRNRPVARLPQAGPFVQRNRRTGEPATTFAIRKNAPASEPVDAAIRRKLDFARGAKLARRFAPDCRWDAWPLNLSPEEHDLETGAAETDGHERDFPFPDERRYLALIHADGNGLGQLLMNLHSCTSSDNFIAVFRDFSEAVAGATQRAAQQATTTVLKPARMDDVFPARPIVLGGDDLTLIVRADLALSFTRHFLAAFASESEAALRRLADHHRLDKLPTHLTACAGIAYTKASQPFYMLHELAEGLCKHAKRCAKATPNSSKEVPSALAFHRVTTALTDDYREVLAHELTADKFRQTLECYALEAECGLPVLDCLIALKELLDDRQMSRGPTRQLLGLVGRDMAQARRHYNRWREIMNQRLPRELGRFDTLLSALNSTESTGDLPYGPTDADGLRRSPLVPCQIDIDG